MREARKAEPRRRQVKLRTREIPAWKKLHRAVKRGSAKAEPGPAEAKGRLSTTIESLPRRANAREKCESPLLKGDRMQSIRVRESAGQTPPAKAGGVSRF